MSNTSSPDVIKQSLHDMIKCCKDIQRLLTSDTEHLSKNAINDIKVSNANKETAIENLNSLTQQLSSLPSDVPSNNLFEKMIAMVKNQDSIIQKEVRDLVDSLKTEITKSYDLLTINSTILASHIHTTKTLWDNLLACGQSTNNIYDNKGNTNK